jgi:hypothetical protein
VFFVTGLTFILVVAPTIVDGDRQHQTHGLGDSLLFGDYRETGARISAIRCSLMRVGSVGIFSVIAVSAGANLGCI